MEGTVDYLHQDRTCDVFSETCDVMSSDVFGGTLHFKGSMFLVKALIAAAMVAD